MCGRYVILTEDENIEMREIIAEINRRHHGDPKAAAMKTGEIRPTNVVPVVGMDGADLMTWGMPQYDRPGVLINARSETVTEKRTYASAFKSRRVAVPTSGFFEWTHEGKKSKDKFLFRLPDSNVLYLAGIYTEYPDEEGVKEPRFVILTTDANASMIPYHDRMPVYIAPSELNAWINDPAAAMDIICRSQPDLVAVPAEPEKPKKQDPEQLSLF